MNERRQPVALLGLGRMGMPMARHLIAAGWPVVGYDPNPERRTLLRDAGGTACETAGDALAEAEIVFVLVGNEAETTEVIRGPGGVAERARPGALVAVMATVAPQLVVELGRALAEQGLQPLDVPLCRGEHGALAGELLSLVAGDAQAAQALEPALRPFSSDVAYLGGRLGAAQVVKSVNNMILWGCLVASAEGLRLAEGYGVDPDQAREVLAISSADNYALRNWSDMHRRPWSAKDMRLALALAEETDVRIPLAGLVSQLVRERELLPSG